MSAPYLKLIVYLLQELCARLSLKVTNYTIYTYAFPAGVVLTSSPAPLEQEDGSGDKGMVNAVGRAKHDTDNFKKRKSSVVDDGKHEGEHAVLTEAEMCLRSVPSSQTGHQEPEQAEFKMDRTMSEWEREFMAQEADAGNEDMGMLQPLVDHLATQKDAEVEGRDSLRPFNALDTEHGERSPAPTISRSNSGGNTDISPDKAMQILLSQHSSPQSPR